MSFWKASLALFHTVAPSAGFLTDLPTGYSLVAMNETPADRREKRREPLYQSRRRYPRVFLDVDWFVESAGCATLGRGLEISPRGALLSIERTGAFNAAPVTLHVCLAGRPRMFKAQGVASAQARESKGWIIRFTQVSAEDLTLLGRTLIDEYGLGALPGLDRKYQRFTALHRRYLRSPI